MSFLQTHTRPIAVILALILLGGAFNYARMQKSLFPDITFPKIKVIADNGLEPVQKMMVTVTKPLENVIKGVPGLEDIRSTTSRGTCEISILMKWGSDLNSAMQQIESRINDARPTLPPDVDIQVQKMTPSILPVMGYSLEGGGLSPIALRQLALHTIKPYLSQIPGVAEIAIQGGETKEFWIAPDLRAMSRLSILPQMITQALSQSNFILSNGYVSDSRRLYLATTDASLQNLETLRNLIILNDSKRTIRLKDVAKVSVHPAVSYVKINANGKSCVLIGILKQPDANLLNVSTGVREKVQSLQHLLPEGVQMKPYYVQADFVHTAIHSVSDALWIGVLLAIAVAILFLRSWKASITILIAVPTAMALAISAISVLGFTINIMTIGALAAAIALVVDDAIVVVEQIHRNQENDQNIPIQTVIRKTMTYLGRGIVASSLSTIVIFIPFILMSGIAGSYFKVLTGTMIVILVSSFLITWIGIPVIYTILTRTKGRGRHTVNHVVSRPRWVLFFIQKPAIGFALAVLFIILIPVLATKLPTGFLPDMDEGTIVLDYVTPPGTSPDVTDRICQEMEKIIMSEPDVESYSRRTGTQMGFFITEPNTGDYEIALKKNRTQSTESVIEDLRRKIENTQPAVRVDFGQVISDMLGDLTTTVQPIEIKILGEDPAILNALARKVAGAIDSIQGVADVFDGITVAGPSIRVSPRSEMLSQYHMTPADLQSQVQMATAGNIVGTILELSQQTNIRMIYSGATTRDIDDIRRQEIFLPDGQLKPLTSLATIGIEKGAAEIQRENLQNMADVTARLEGRDLGSVMKDIRRVVASNIDLPRGYQIIYGGSYASQQESFHELLWILISAVILVFCVMLFFTNDLLSSLAILSCAILGISGSLIALYVTHSPLNVSSYTGIIMIVGIIGENAVFTFLQFEETYRRLGVRDALVYAISVRLRPKLMTAIGAIVALMPLALGIGAGAQLHQPLAIAVIGGLLAGLPLLLIVLPTLLGFRYKKENIRNNQA